MKKELSPGVVVGVIVAVVAVVVVVVFKALNPAPVKARPYQEVIGDQMRASGQKVAGPAADQMRANATYGGSAQQPPAAAGAR